MLLAVWAWTLVLSVDYLVWLVLLLFPRRESSGLMLSEDEIQRHIVKLLSAYGRPDILWLAVPNGDLRNWKVGARLKQQGLRPGAADLIFLIDSRFHGVELKTDIGTLSQRQLDFKEDVERAGGFYHVAFGLDQAIGVLQGISAFRHGVSFSTPAPSGQRVRTGGAADKAVSPDIPSPREVVAPA